MIHELNHFGIVVRDLTASLDFYRGVLGARIVFEGVIPATGTSVVYLQLHGGMIELLYRPDPPEEETFGITHLAFSTDDLDRDFASLLDFGCAPLVEPRVAGTGVGRLAFLSDPNGARVELLERDLHMRVEPFEHPLVAAFDHYALVANDFATAKRFYRELLGLSDVTEIVRDDGLTLTYLACDYDVLELQHRATPIPGPIFPHFGLRVHDLDDALAAFAAVGVTPERGTPRALDVGEGRFGIVRDPDGVEVELLERPDLHDLR
ncbi:VOC family protein [Planctomonas psychrotolerans]|uniref:VOC family protein n=1 Tax=Planctomonas psychrotolerans TaxID=2528712 RepID=UPI001D0CEA75|nr:VOC family protein [Planctomonas psychrotolerans]